MRLRIRQLPVQNQKKNIIKHHCRVALWLLWQWFIIGLRECHHCWTSCKLTTYDGAKIASTSFCSTYSSIYTHKISLTQFWWSFEPNRIEAHYRGIRVLSRNHRRHRSFLLCTFFGSCIYALNHRNKNSETTTTRLKMWTKTPNGHVFLSIIDRLSSWILCQASALLQRKFRRVFRECVCISCALLVFTMSACEHVVFLLLLKRWCRDVCCCECMQIYAHNEQQ